MQPGENSVSRLGLEVENSSHRPVVFTDWLVQEDSGPLSLPELCVTDELNAAGLDPVHKDSLANNE